MYQDKLVGWMGILIVIPITMFFIVSKWRNRSSMYLLLPPFFLKGALEMVSGEDLKILKLILEVFIFSQLIQLGLKQRKLRYELNIMLIILGLSVISYLLNNVPFKYFVGFTRAVFLPIAIIVIAKYKPFRVDQIEAAIKYIILMLLCQVIVNILRVPFTGITEYYIGSISKLGGSLTVLVSIVGGAVFTVKYIFKKKISYLIAIVGLLAFGIIGYKRVLIFLLPLLIMIASILELIRRNKKIYFVNLIAVGIISIMIIFIGIKIFPELNPEHKLWGRVDVHYAISFIKEYLNPGKPVTGQLIRVAYYGRGDVWVGLVELFKERKLPWLLFGGGPGDIMLFKDDSKLSSLGIISVEDLISYKYGIGYGARTGLIFLIFQIGLLGAMLFVWIFSKYIINGLRIYFKLCDEKTIHRELIFLLILFFLFFDFLAYSYNFFLWESSPFILLCFLFYRINYASFRVS